MANGEIFKTVMRGYAKEEVIAYISGLNEDIKSLTAENERKEAQIGRLTEELDAVRATTAEPTDEQIEALRSTLSAEIEEKLRRQYDQELAKKQEEYDLRLAKQASEMQARLELSDALEKKVKEYEEYKASLADLLIEARKNADQVIAKAYEEAEQIRRQTQTELTDFLTGFSTLKQNIGATKLDIQKNLDDAAAALSIFDQKLSVLQKDIDDATHTFRAEESRNNHSDW